MHTHLKFTILVIASLLSGCLTVVAQTPETSADSQPADFTGMVHPQAADSRIRVISPQAGQIFNPGATFPVMVSVDRGLAVQAATVDLSGISTVLDGQSGTGTFNGTAALPEDFTGLLVITPSATLTDGSLIQGMPVSVLVRPKGNLIGIVPAITNFVLSSPDTAVQLKVTGVFPNNATMDMTAPETGTTYRTRDTNILKVGADGTVQPLGFGTGTVMISNANAQASVTFTIEDPAHPLPPEDLTSHFSIYRNNLTLDQASQLYTVTYTLANINADPAIGPLYFVLDGLPKGVWLIDGYGTRLLKPENTWFIPLPLANGTSLPSSGVLTLHLRFRALNAGQLDCKPKVYRSSLPL